MIVSLSANRDSFHSVRFGEGFNLIVADSTEASEETDTRNGVGKSLLIEAIHFCLGSSATRKAGVVRDELSGWEFTLELRVGDETFGVTRSVDAPGHVRLTGSFDGWPAQPAWNADAAAFELSVAEWTRVLGTLMFGLDEVAEQDRFRPTFRLLIPHFARVGRGAYETPFKFFSGEREWQKQVSIAFLLGLGWQQAARWQELKEQEDALRRFRNALRTGALSDGADSVGRLRARRAALQERIQALEGELRGFQVHPQYAALTEELNALTERIHAIVNTNVTRRRRIELYAERLGEEVEPDAEEVEQLFAEAGVSLGDAVRRTLADAQEFHEAVVRNRRAYLRDEMTRLEREFDDAQRETESLSEERSRRMRILETHHALEELEALQQRAADLRAQRADLDARINRIEEIDERESELAIEREHLLLSARRELLEREPTWSQDAALFARNTEALYGEPGELVIDVGSAGFQFDVRIARSGSHGVSNMKIFAFDLVLAQRWAAEPRQPGFLIHDSELFDGVDERQVAAALRLADSEARNRGFQYICSLNTDAMPRSEYLHGLDVEPLLRLTDERPEMALFGFRWD